MRYYNLRLQIKGARPDKVTNIIDACKQRWLGSRNGMFDYASVEDGIELESDGCIDGGKTEEEFADEISHIIWDTNRAFCTITVSLLLLDDLPFNEYIRTEVDYAEYHRKRLKNEYGNV